MRYALSKDDLRMAFQVSYRDVHRGTTAADAFFQEMANEFCSTWPVYSQAGSEVGRAAALVDGDIPEMTQVTDFSLAVTESLINAILDYRGMELETLPSDKLKGLCQSLITMLGNVFEDGKPDAAYMKVYVACCLRSSLKDPFSVDDADDWAKSPFPSDSVRWSVVLNEAKQERQRQKPDADASASTEAALSRLTESGFLICQTPKETARELLRDLLGNSSYGDTALFADIERRMALAPSVYRLKHYAEAQRIIDGVLPGEVCAHERV